MFWVSLLWILAWKSILVIIKSLYFTASSKIWCTGSQCKSRSTTCRIFWTLWKKFQLSEDRNKDKRWWRILSERWYSEMYGKWLQTLYVVYRRSTDKRLIVKFIIPNTPLYDYVLFINQKHSLSWICLLFIEIFDEIQMSFKRIVKLFCFSKALPILICF